MNNAYAPNTRKTLERVNKRMKELPIEVFKSMEDLQQLPVRELKARYPADVTDNSVTMPTALQEMLRWKRVEHQHLVEKRELLRALVESDSTSNRTCSICCEDYASGDVLRILPCKHKYHLECIEKWFVTSSQYVRSPSCPYCNTPLFRDE